MGLASAFFEPVGCFLLTEGYIKIFGKALGFGLWALGRTTINEEGDHKFLGCSVFGCWLARFLELVRKGTINRFSIASLPIADSVWVVIAFSSSGHLVPTLDQLTSIQVAASYSRHIAANLVAIYWYRNFQI